MTPTRSMSTASRSRRTEELEIAALSDDERLQSPIR